jgi:hypothetical protein
VEGLSPPPEGVGVGIDALPAIPVGVNLLMSEDSAWRLASHRLRENTSQLLQFFGFFFSSFLCRLLSSLKWMYRFSTE